MGDDLLNHLKAIGNLPYLFVGSGFSRRYIGMESWQDLLEAITKIANIPKPFTYYLTECSKDYPLLGGLISDAFYESFYSSDYKSLYPFITDEILKAGDKDTPIKYLIANYINSKLISSSLSPEIDLLKTSKIAGVITTNWDNLLEDIFPDFKTYVGQEMMFAEALNYGEIFKIHGSVGQPNSMVLTQRDYNAYQIRNAYLSAKLLTIFVEHPVVFIGYSLSDPNILHIINSIFTSIRKEDHAKFKDRLIFIEFDPTATKPSFMDGTLSVSNGTFLPIKHIKSSNFSDVYTVLSKLEQTIPMKVLVKLKDMLYDFVVSNKPNEKIYVGNISEVDDATLDKIQAVFGVGAAEMFEYGYRSVSAADIFKDILSDKTTFDVDKLLTLTFPEIFRSAGYIPIRKYLKMKGIASVDDIRGVYTTFDSRLVAKLKRISFNNLMPAASYVAHKPDVNKLLSFKELTANYDNWHVLLYVHLLDHDKIDLNDLREFLLNAVGKYNKNTDFRKAICLYDLLTYQSA